MSFAMTKMLYDRVGELGGQVKGGDLRSVEIAFGEAHLNLSGLPPPQLKI